MAVAVLHIALVAPRYHVGSFDDDASYILAARGLLHGAGLTGLLTGGRPVVGYYPPGYAAVIAPLVAISGTHYLVLRAFSALCAAAVLPLTWWYLGRRGIGEWARVAVLLLMALSPVFATYGSMVMAEMPFLVVLICWLALADRWEGDRSRLGAAGAGTVVAGAALVWLKEAGVGLVAGMVVWLVLRRCWRRAALVAGGTALLVAPVLVARAAIGVPLAGARYSSELGTYFRGGVWAHLGTAVYHGIDQLVVGALPQTLLPTGIPPLPTAGPVHAILSVWGWSVPVLCAAGAVVWMRRYRDAAVVAVVAYLAEILVYPFVNQRRVVLVLPVVAAWYVIGGGAGLQVAAAAARRLRRRPLAGWRAGGPARAVVALAGVVLIVVPLAWQLPRDYLFAGGQSSSDPLGSPYMALLARLGQPGDVVENDYLSTTALATGHRTASSAFSATTNPLTGNEQSCSPVAELAALRADHAAYLLTADLNKPGTLDSPCLLKLASSSVWAVPLLHTARDDATVFELVGPGTPHPHLGPLTPAPTRRPAPPPPPGPGWPAKTSSR